MDSRNNTQYISQEWEWKYNCNCTNKLNYQVCETNCHSNNFSDRNDATCADNMYYNSNMHK